MTDQRSLAALTLTVDVVCEDDRTSLSYATLRESYIFAEFVHSRSSPRDRLQGGTMIAVASSLKEFIEQFQFLTRVDLLSICDRHCIAMVSHLCLQGLRDVFAVISITSLTRFFCKGQTKYVFVPNKVVYTSPPGNPGCSKVGRESVLCLCGPFSLSRRAPLDCQVTCVTCVVVSLVLGLEACWAFGSLVLVVFPIPTDAAYAVVTLTCSCARS
ncbi:hypothetical protein BKA82DRAFT_4189057 [Pisolithus tinctorius]|nr:hypothetical protein BKA82DRAFT_4189057 [Pisolithus tinctorius]